MGAGSCLVLQFCYRENFLRNLKTGENIPARFYFLELFLFKEETNLVCRKKSRDHGVLHHCFSANSIPVNFLTESGGTIKLRSAPFTVEVLGNTKSSI